jgi:uncharacterized protein with von Willebrand factor type A (vWA) domain
LRSGLCSCREEWDRFEELFEQFWSGPSGHAARRPARRAHEERSTWAWIGNNGNSGWRAEEETRRVSGASLHQRLRKADFSEVPQEDQDALERTAERLVKRAGFQLSRRLKISESEAQVDLRRTIRRSIGRGDDPLELRFKGKKPRPVRLVILLDISGSMSLYSFFLLRFAHALQRHFQESGHVRFQHLAGGYYERVTARAPAGCDENTLPDGRGLDRRHEDRRIARRIQPALCAAHAGFQHAVHDSARRLGHGRARKF